MGEYADMMLDGTLCEACGTYIDDEGGDGLPRYCSNQCARDRGALHALPNAATVPNPNKTECPYCRRRVKLAGLVDHVRTMHPGFPSVAMFTAAPDVTASLAEMVDLYTQLAGSGDCGHWDPELEAQVVRARAVLAKARGEA